MSAKFTIGEAREIVAPITAQSPEDIKGIIVITVDQDHEPRMFGSLTRSGLIKVLGSMLTDLVMAEMAGAPDVGENEPESPNPLAGANPESFADDVISGLFGDESA